MKHSIKGKGTYPEKLIRRILTDQGIRYKLNVKEYNIYNCTEYQIKPIDGLLILFPSEVHHKILKNNSNIVRHSLAFNIIPVGEIGSNDSYLNIEVK